MHAMSAREETARQIAHCMALRKRLGEQRRTLDRESAVQAAVTRRLETRIVAGGLGEDPRVLLDRQVDLDRRLADARSGWRARGIARRIGPG